MKKNLHHQQYQRASFNGDSIGETLNVNKTCWQ